METETKKDFINKALDIVGLKAGHILLMVGSVVLFFVMVLLTADAIMVKVGHPFLGAPELTEECMVVMAFAGVAYVQMQDRHIGLDIFTNRLSQRGQYIMQTFGYIASLVVGAILSWRTTILFTGAVQMAQEKGGPLSLPLWPSHLIIMVSMYLLTLVLALQVINNLRSRRRKVTR